MPLTLSQQRGYDEVIGLFRRGCRRVRLIGSAGTGKTYLSNELARFFKEDRKINPHYNNGQIFITAPTNKALAVLRSKVDIREGAGVVFKTIHSSLRMKRVRDSKSGQVSFIRGKFYGNDSSLNFDLAKMCIIDEASMLPSEIEGNCKDIAGHLAEMKFPILYIGDNKQLAPVGEKASPVFLKPYPEVVLTEIIRQGKGNPIIDLSNDLDMIWFKKPTLVDGKGYIYSDDTQQLIDDLAQANGTDELKYLAYTNAVVDTMNKLVRVRRYGNPKKIEKEETLVFNSPYGPHYTNKEVKVEDLEIVTDWVQVPREKTRYESGMAIGEIDRIRMKFYLINGEIKVVHEHSESIHKELVDSLKYNSKNLNWDWNCIDHYQDQFADIKYNHSLTVHKSQGSTYKEAIVNIGDISKASDIEDKTRLLYTAITRASNLIILNSVR